MTPVAWPALVSGALLSLVPTAVRADLWTLDSNVEGRLETDDNASLSTSSTDRVSTASVGASLALARRTENTATSLNGDLSAFAPSGGAAQKRIDGRLALTHAYSDPRHSVSLGVNLAQDFNDDLLSVDVTQARGQRRTTSLSAGWTHAWTERLSSSAQLGTTRAGYGQQLTRATDFRNTSVTLGASYRVTETTTATAQTSLGEYRTESGNNRSATRSVDFGLARTFNERANASLSLGGYETRRSVSLVRLACPLPVNFCVSGLVPYTLVSEQATSSSTGLQFNATARYQFNERTGLQFNASRQQTPSGAGTVVRSDSLSLGASHSWSPTFGGTLNYSQSRSTLTTASGDARPGQRSFTAAWSKQLEPHLSLQGGYRHSTADRLGDGATARSNTFYLALKHEWAKFEASR